MIRAPMPPAARRCVLADLGEILTAGRLDSPDLNPVETYTHGFSGICFCSAQHVRSLLFPEWVVTKQGPKKSGWAPPDSYTPETMSSPIVDRDVAGSTTEGVWWSRTGRPE